MCVCVPTNVSLSAFFTTHVPDLPTPEQIEPASIALPPSQFCLNRAASITRVINFSFVVFVHENSIQYILKTGISLPCHRAVADLHADTM